MTDAWLFDDRQELSRSDALEESLVDLRFEEAAADAQLAVVLRDATIHETHKLFGRADVRIDALFVTATGDGDLYHPGTFTFGGVKDHDRLPIDEAGMMLYFGRPRYFLDMALIASRGGDDKPLAALLTEHAPSFGELLGGVAALAMGAPAPAALTAAAAAAGNVAALALQLLDQVTGKSIGLYRATWFAQRDRFGIGDHPADGGRFLKGDFEFRYEIFKEASAPS